MRDRHRIDDGILVRGGDGIEVRDDIRQLYEIIAAGDGPVHDDRTGKLIDVDAGNRDRRLDHSPEVVERLLGDRHDVIAAAHVRPDEQRRAAKRLPVHYDLARADRNDAGDLSVSHRNAQQSGRLNDDRLTGPNCDGGPASCRDAQRRGCDAGSSQNAKRRAKKVMHSGSICPGVTRAA